ncbi:MAG: PEP-CTERM sorting domain-containing protein [Pseudomonadota bacterium]
MKKIKVLLVSALLTLTFYSHATLITVANDNADNYGNVWSGNGGFGFNQWNFIVDPANGSAGGFLANKINNPDLNNVASSPNNKAWGSYANGNGFNQFEAYRDFGSNALNNNGDSFQLSFEHGNITDGGSVGFVLRNQNIHNAIGDYNQQSRFEFGFIGGGSNYSIFDNYGVIDTGIAFTDAGLNLTLTLLSANQYQLDIFNANGNVFLQSRNGILKGSGSIDSVALYNRNSELANVYFNNLAITKSTSVPEPNTSALITSALLLLIIRRKPNKKD